MSQYDRVSTVAEASSALRDESERTEIIAGGQSLMLDIRDGETEPDKLVDISEIDRLQGVSHDDETVRIGAATTYATVADSRIVDDEFPMLAATMARIAGPQIRYNGTIGGGLCYGDPKFDAPPVLLALDAELLLEDVDGSRRLPLTEFYVGHSETALADSEILTGIVLPKPNDGIAGCYQAMTPRQGSSTIAGVATVLQFDGEYCRTARIGLTAGDDRPIRSHTAERELEGRPVSEERIDAAAESVSASLNLPDRPQASKSYREKLFRRLTAHTVQQCRKAGSGR